MTIEGGCDQTRSFGTCSEVNAIPAMLRRRLGEFGRMAAQCALGVAPMNGPSDLVFCSRHGDTNLTHELLTSCLSGEPVSPTKFSLSVHNAVAGIVDLLRHDRTGHTAIAAGHESLSAGLIEAILRLAEQPDVPAIVVYADLPLATAYRDIYNEEAEGVALALRLVSRRTATTLAQIANPEIRAMASTALGSSGDVAHSFLSVLEPENNTKVCLEWFAQGSAWELRRS